MDRREILNELAQIVAITDTVGSDYGIPEAARRAKGLIREIECWPIAFPPAPFVSDQCCERHHGCWNWFNAYRDPIPFVSDQCCERHHGECQLGSANAPFSKLCHCACHCPPEGPQKHGCSVIDPKRPPCKLRDMPLETPLSEVMDATQIERGQELGTLIYAVQSWTQQVWLMERKLESFQRDAAVQSPESQPAPPQDAQGQERAIPDVEWLAGYGPEALRLGRQARLEYCATLTGILRQATLTTRFQSPDGQQVPPEAPRQDPESEPPVEQHIDTPDELLELLAGISSDPQVEGLSLAQKASTIALLHIAKAVQQIAYQLEDIDTALEQIGIRISDGPVDPQAGPEGRRGTGQKPDAPTFDATVLEGKDTAAWESWAEGLPGLARKFAWTLIAASNRAGMPPAAVQSPGSPQEPS